LPTGAGEDASPLGLRPVSAAEDGEDATHGGWTRRGRASIGVEWMRLRTVRRSEERDAEISGRSRRIYSRSARLRGIASEQSSLLWRRRRGHVAAVGWEGSVRGGSLSLPDAAQPSQRGAPARVSSCSETHQPSDARWTANRDRWKQLVGMGRRGPLDSPMVGDVLCDA
jgi:hypothetical protein